MAALLVLVTVDDQAPNPVPTRSITVVAVFAKAFTLDTGRYLHVSVAEIDDATVILAADENEAQAFPPLANNVHPPPSVVMSQYTW